MKKICVLLFCFSVSVTSVIAQTPLNDFYQTGTNWTWYSYVNHAFSRGTSEVYNDFISGDSTVNSYTYKLIKRYKKGRVYHDHGSITTTRYDSSDKTLVGGIRVDGEKVFFINLSADTNRLLSLPPMSETIIYDFLDLKIGDTISWKPYKNIVIDIDSVMLSNGKYEKRYHFEKTNYDDFWVRGAGCSMGFLMSHTAQPYMYYYLAKYYAVCYNGSANYKYYESAPLDSAIVDNCYLIFPLAVNEVNTKSGLAIYPNPVLSNRLNIDVSTDALDIRIYDVSGKLINILGHTPKGIHTIQAPTTPGIYTIVVLDEGTGDVSYSRFEKL